MFCRGTQLKIRDELLTVEGLERKQIEQTRDLRDSQSSIAKQLLSLTQGVQTVVHGNKLAESEIDVMTRNQSHNARKLDNIILSLKELQPTEEIVGNTGVYQASTADVLAKILRAELRQSVIPEMKQIFQLSKASTDLQLERTRRSIDALSGEVGSILNSKHEKPVGTPESDTVAQSPATQVLSKGDTIEESPFLNGTIDKADLRQQSKRVECKRYQWKLRLPIGVFWAAVAVRTKRKTNVAVEAYKIQKQPFSRTYRMTITFVPLQNPIKIKGVEMVYKIKQDHLSTYPEICPTIIPFNIVPDDADVFECVRRRDVDGLKTLLQERRASPSDRDSLGATPLHVGLTLMLLLK